MLPVKVPPLDERRDEILQWARFMALRRHRESVPSGSVELAAGVEKLLCEHDWPGNLRQLDNVVRRAYTLALMGHGGAVNEVLLEERHFVRALSYERGTGRRSLLGHMRVAAAAFVEEAERLEERGLGLDLDLCDAFRGFVLGTAMERLGSRDAAFRMLGKAQLVQNRNHYKALRREFEKVDALCKALGDEDENPFAGLGEDEP